MLACLYHNEQSSNLQIYSDNEIVVAAVNLMLANRFVLAEAHHLHYLHILLAKEIERRKSKQYQLRVSWVPSHWEEKLRQDPEKWTCKLNHYKETMLDWKRAKMLNEHADAKASSQMIRSE